MQPLHFGRIIVTPRSSVALGAGLAHAEPERLIVPFHSEGIFGNPLYYAIVDAEDRDAVLEKGGEPPKFQNKKYFWPGALDRAISKFRSLRKKFDSVAVSYVRERLNEGSDISNQPIIYVDA